MADTAALVVALSAQLTKFEKDMKDAVKVADQRTKEIENSFSRMNKEIEQQLSNTLQAYSSQIGSLGRVLQSIGPIGLTVGAAIGALALGFSFVSDKVDKFAEKARELKDTSETLDLSTQALKALSVAGQSVGLDFEQTERGVRKLAVSVQTLRETGSGPLFDVLLKVNKGLIDQITGAKNTEEAINILANAYKELNKQQQLQLSTALGGQRNLGIGRILGALPEGGALTQKAQEQLDKGFSPELIERVAKLRQEIEAIQKRTDTIWGTAFAESNLTASKAMATAWLAISEGVIKTANSFPGLASFFERIQRGAQKALEAGRRAEGTPSPTQGAVPDIIAPVGPAIDKTAEAQARLTQQLVAQLNVMKAWTTVVGDALTQVEQLKQKELELNVAVSKGEATRDQANRQLAEYKLKLDEANVAIKERLGVASQDEILQTRLARVNADATKFALTSTEAERGRAKAVLDSQKAYEAMVVSASKTPELARFAFDAANGFKQFDQFVTTAFTGFESALGSVANGTTKLADAFKSMANSIISDLVRIAVRMSVTGPLAGALSGLFGNVGATAAFPEGLNSPGVLAPLTPGGFLPQRQGGGPVSSGRGYIVGEHGTELFVPSSSGMIVSHGGGGSSKGTTVEINNYAAADTETKQQSQPDGAGGERIIVDIVKRASARGEFDDANRGRFGLRPQKVR